MQGWFVNYLGYGYGYIANLGHSVIGNCMDYMVVSWVNVVTSELTGVRFTAHSARSALVSHQNAYILKVARGTYID